VKRGKVRHEVMKTTVACRMTTQPEILLSVFYLDVHHW
jgi:hypothetical protein